MKKIIVACLVLFAQFSYTHQEDNPYYNFIKKHTLPFAQSLSFQEKVECLQFLTNYAEPKESWFERLCTYVQHVYNQFLEAYNTCVTTGACTVAHTSSHHHRDEFSIYAIAGLYRVIYEQAIDNNAAAYLHDKNIVLLTPDEVESECFESID